MEVIAVTIVDEAVDLEFGAPEFKAQLPVSEQLLQAVHDGDAVSMDAAIRAVIRLEASARGLGKVAVLHRPEQHPE